MNFLYSMLGAASWAEIAESVGWAKGWVGDLLNTLSQVMWVAMALVGAAGGIYAIYVGVKMARAESAEQREENKKRLINIIVSIIVVIVLIIVFNVFVPMVIGNIDSLDAPATDGSVHAIVDTARVLLRL